MIPMIQSRNLNRAALAMLVTLGALSAGCGKQEVTASSDERKDATVADAQINGMPPGAGAQQGAETTQSRLDETRIAVSDAAITAEVNAKIAQDKELEATKIDVKVSNGAVVLQGTAPTDAAVLRAVALAQGTSGVTSVNSELKINGS